MIQYTEHSHIDFKKWDSCISKSTNSSVFVTSWYLNAACPNWSALILNDYEAVFPLAGNSKLGLPYLYQPLFTRYLGVYTCGEISEKLVNDFFEAIPPSFKYIEFSLHENNPFNKADFEKKERLFQILELSRSYENLQNEFKGDAKRNIKKAEKNQLTVTNEVSPQQVVDLFKNNKGKELKGLNNADYELLTNLMTAALDHNSGFLVGVKNQENMLVAAGFFITHNNRILFLKGSANAEGKSTGAMYLVLNHVFKTYSNSYKLFDFGGSSVETVASFNHNFGAKDCVYLQVKRNRLPFIIKLISGKK